ncbi:MAG: phosphoribosylamine--glycine ligase [Rubricoccaceae bacterium]
MRILVVGSGGREHVLCHALAQSPRQPEVLCAPGNAGTADLAENVAIGADDVDGLVELAQQRAVDLVVVGPEVPLVLGLADRLVEVGIDVVGPSKAAAQLEGSKAFAKDVMARCGVPTAASRTFDQDSVDEARAYVEAHPLPVVLKADGLAAGKGVVVAETREAAREALRDMMDDGAFGEAGATVVVEAFLKGEEASVFVLTDGADYVCLPAAQDHKRIGEGDTGPNTGGMGAYAPAPVVTPEVMNRIEREVVQPMLDGMRDAGHPYQGILYVGLMIDEGAPNVVEFNCRFGDPEAQVLLPLLQTDAVDLFEAMAQGRLSDIDLAIHDGAAACVVLASEGYPGSYEKGRRITGFEAASSTGALVFHAGVARDGSGETVTNGGRVIGVTGVGDDLEAALGTAYAAADVIAFEGKTLRRDIGQKGLRHVASRTS